MPLLLCGKFQERDVGLKEEENCFLDPFYLFFLYLGFLLASHSFHHGWVHQRCDVNAEKGEGPSGICSFLVCFVSCMTAWFPMPEQLNLFIAQ